MFALAMAPEFASAQPVVRRCEAYFATRSSSGIHPSWSVRGGTPISVGEMRAEPALGGRGSTRWENTPTIRVTGSLPGRFGGRLRILRRVGREWHSEFAPDETVAVQGDPRNLVAMTSSQVGFLFGFTQLSADRITVPDAVELRGALASLNRSLIALGFEPIPIQFVEASGLEDDRAFLTAWAQRGEMPISAEGDAVFLHDLGFHAHSIVLPPEVVRHSRAVFARRLEFVDWLSNRAQRDPSLSWVSTEHWVAMIQDFLSLSLDGGTGHLFISYLARLDRSSSIESRRSEAQASAESVVGRLAAGGMSPDRSLVRLFSNAPVGWEIAAPGSHFASLLRDSGLSPARLARLRDVRQLASEFMQRYRSEGSRTPMVGYASSPEWLLARVDARRLELSRAARNALSRPVPQ